MAQKVEKTATVVATFDVIHDNGIEEGVRTHEKAWVLTHQLSPASATFIGWKRKD